MGFLPMTSVTQRMPILAPQPDPSNQKRELRAQVRVALAKIPVADFARLSPAACARILTLPEFEQAATLMIFLPGHAELDCSAFAHAAWAAGKVVAAPRIDWQNARMSPQVITSLTKGLETRRHNIAEPVDAPGARIEPAALDLILVPGLAFDLHGGRLGKGGGFYDRFLGQFAPRAFAVGLALDEQIVPAIPMGPLDARVHAVATPTRLLRR